MVRTKMPSQTPPSPSPEHSPSSPEHDTPPAKKMQPRRKNQPPADMLARKKREKVGVSGPSRSRAGQTEAEGSAPVARPVEKRKRVDKGKAIEKDPKNLPAADPTRWRSQYAEELFKARRAHKWRVITELQLVDSTDGILELRKLFRDMGWSAAVNLPNKYYPKLVHEFYVNFKVTSPSIYSAQEDPFSFETMVRGVRIFINRETFREFEGDHGNSFGLGEHWAYRVDDPDVVAVNFSQVMGANISLEDAAMRLGFHYMWRGNPKEAKKVWKVTWSPPRMHALIYVIGKNVKPRPGNFDEARAPDVLIGAALRLKDPERINLPLQIIRSMIEAGCDAQPGKYMPFPRLLTRIFQKFGVDVSGDRANDIDDRDEWKYHLNDAFMEGRKMKRIGRSFLPVVMLNDIAKRLVRGRADLYDVGFDAPVERVIKPEAEFGEDTSQPPTEGEVSSSVMKKLVKFCKGLSEAFQGCIGDIKEMRAVQESNEKVINDKLDRILTNNRLKPGEAPAALKKYPQFNVEFPKFEEEIEEEEDEENAEEEEHFMDTFFTDDVDPTL